MQNHYNLVYREEEREMIPLCLDEGVAILPWNSTSWTSLARSDARGSLRPPAQIALAWLLGKPAVTAPIVGATKLDHLQDAIAATDVSLTEEESRRLEAPYRPPPDPRSPRLTRSRSARSRQPSASYDAGTPSSVYQE